MLTKTNELIGPMLDWAVANAQGIRSSAMVEVDCGQAQFRPLERWCAINVTMVGHEVFDPSTDWNQGGPIIEREGICLKKGHSGWWIAKLLDVNDEEHFVTVAPTPLVAAMRCYVMSKLGNEVDIPKELL